MFKVKKNKNFFWIFIILLIIILSLLFLINNKDKYVLSNFYIENSQVINKQNNERFNIKGVIYSPYYPNETGGELLANDKRYFDHLKKIKDLGANSVSVFPQKMPENFYNSLEENDLYYSQIIDINLYDGTDNNDLLNEEYQKKVMTHVREVIDHNYNSGQIDRLIYFTLGYEINPNYLKYTNDRHKNVNSYKGRYVSIRNRTASEVALAKILDKSIKYEVKTYNRRSLYSHNSFPAYGLLNDRPFLYPNFFDILAINLYPSFFYDKDDYYISEEKLNNNNGFIDFVGSILKKSELPVVISETGLPTNSGTSSIPPYGDNSEEAVSSLYKRSWSDIEKAEKLLNNDRGLNGIFFFEFLDEWWKNGEEENDAKYHNPNDSEEWFGLYKVEKESDKLILKPKKEIIETLKLIFKSYD